MNKHIAYLTYCAKAATAGVVAFGGALTTALSDGQVTTTEWITIGSATVAAVLGVFEITNGSKPAKTT